MAHCSMCGIMHIVRISAFVVGWILFPLLCTDAAITWIKPVPQHTPTNRADIRTTKIQLLNGSSEQRLIWDYNLTSETLDKIFWEIQREGDVTPGTRIGIKRPSGSVGISDPNFLEHFNISSSDPATLIIYDVTEADEAVFSCNVENDLGQVWTDNIRVEVVEEAKITNDSGSQTGCEGSNVTVFCNVTGKPAPNITWTRVLENGSDSEVLQHDTTTEFVLNKRSDSGTYRCAAYNGVGRSSNRTLNVSVDFPPSIEPLFNQTATEGQNVFLSCEASGKPPPTVRWILPGGDLLEQGNNTILSNIRRNQSGKYICEASNRCAKINTSVSVIVEYAPSIVNISDNRTQDEDEDVTLSCIADSNPAANITWTKVSDGSRVFFPLTIAGKQDEGFYRCTAYNGIGSPAIRDVFITVANFHPFNTQVTTTLPNNITVVNETFTVTCTAEANPPAEYMLFKDGVSLSNLTSNQTDFVTSVTEKISQALYKCIPFNHFGNGPEDDITIAVHYGPDDVTLKTNVSGGIACAGDVVHLNCTADASPPATFVLFEQGATASMNNTQYKPYQYGNEVMVPEAMPGFWISPVTAMTDYVHYRCVANNSVGSGESNNVTLTVHVAASVEPVTLTETVTEGQSKSLYCNASGKPSPMVSWTKIGTGPIFNENVLNFTSINRTDAGTYTCEATNECGNATTMTRIVVHYRPENIKLTTNLTGLKTCQGTLVAFNCTAQGNPQPNIALHQDGVMLSEVSEGFWIKALTTEGDLVFSCIANNTAGTEARNNTVTVNVAASIVEVTPASLTVKEGQNVTLYCNVSGSSEPNVTWTNMNSSDSSSGKKRFLPAINRSQAGVYRCDANNDCGSDSRTVTVTVLYKPETVRLTTNATGNTCEGAPVRFTCTADAIPVPSYKLYENNVMVSEAQVSPGVWILTMPVGGNHQYQCKANNSEGTTASDNATLTVYVGPSLVVPVGNRNVVEGDNVSLHCNVSGSPSPSISWTTVSNFEKRENPLLIPAIKQDQAGVYICNAMNDCGHISESVTVTVRYRPAIPNLENKNLTRGANITLYCNATGNPPPSVSWTKTSSGETRPGNTWDIVDASGDDAGEYKCEASNSVGNESDTLNVTIQYQPQDTMLVSNLSEIEVCSGAVVNFTCTADARPDIHVYQLKRNDTVIEENDHGIWSIELVDEGNSVYSCVANNSLGSGTSSSSQIIVNSAPSVVSLPDHEEWVVGESRSLTCMVTGKPMPSVAWTENGQERTSNITLVFPSVTKSDQGVYTCEANNDCGNYTQSINITVFADNCEEKCDADKGEMCTPFDTYYVCACPLGKKGDNCEDDDVTGEKVTTNFKIENEPWKGVYEDLENEETKQLTAKIEKQMKDSFSNLNKSRVLGLREGSVAVNIEMTFNMAVRQSVVESALKEAIVDGKLGPFEISNVGNITATPAPAPTPSPTVAMVCGSFYDGDNCDKVKSQWLALIIVAALVVIASILATIAFCMHKKGKREGSVSIEGGPRKEENGFRNGNNYAGASGPYARDNIGYSGETLHSNSNQSDPNMQGTPMVTFSTSQQGNNGIHLDDPRASKKAEPGDGTYADLGHFSQKQPAPRTEPVAPVLRPPAYEETQYAEITHFMKGPANSDQKTEEEKGVKGEEELTAADKPDGPDSDNVKSTEEPQEEMEITVTDF